MLRIVVDTNVLVAGLRSRRGASYVLLQEMGRGRFEMALSVPLLLEYEEALVSQVVDASLTEVDVEAVLDYVCSVSHLQAIFYLWRPVLPDADDDMVLELAVAAGCRAVVTHNVRDFKSAERFNVAVWTPYEFLRLVGVLK